MRLDQYFRFRAAHRWLTVGAILILSHPAQSTPIPAACEGVKDGLVACYPFDGNTSDLSGKNYHGVPKNIIYVEGQAGQAARFDGKTSYVEIANAPELNAPQMSFSAWVKPTINVNRQGNPVGHGMIFNKELQYELAIFEEDSPVKPIKGGEFSFAFGNNWDWMPAPGAFVPPNKFVHVALTFTKERTAKLYVEGKLIREQQYANPLGGNALCVRIGARNCPNPNPSLSFRDMFEGDIDEFRIYNRELSETEVKQLAGVAEPVVPPAPPVPSASLCKVVPNDLLACYPFDGDTNDYSGNHYDAKILQVDPSVPVTLTESRHNRPNNAYKFVGNSHNKIGLVLRDENFALTNAMSISLWFKTTAHANFDGIINFHSRIDENNCCQYRMMLDPNLHPFYDAGAHADQTINNFTFKPDTWYHYVMVVRGGDAAEIYVNGELIAKSNAGVPQTLPSGKYLFIGSDGFIEKGGRDLHSFEGVVDDLLIYKRALSAEDVRWLYYVAPQKIVAPVEPPKEVIPPPPPPPASFNVVVSKTGTGDVKAADNSIDCGATCQFSYVANSSVNLTATPAAGYLFKEWSGDCAGNTPAVTLTVDKAKNCTATFVQQQPAPMPTTPSQLCFGVTGTYGQDRVGYCNDYGFEGNNVPCLFVKNGELVAGECAQDQLAPKPLANNVLPYAKQASVGKNFSAVTPRCDASVEFGTDKSAAPSGIGFVCVRYQKAAGSFYYGVALVNSSQVLSYKVETSADMCVGNCAK